MPFHTYNGYNHLTTQVLANVSAGFHSTWTSYFRGVTEKANIFARSIKNSRHTESYLVQKCIFHRCYRTRWIGNITLVRTNHFDKMYIFLLKHFPMYWNGTILKSLIVTVTNLPITHFQNHGCWWAGDTMSINNHGTELVQPKYIEINRKGISIWFKIAWLVRWHVSGQK